MLASLPLLASTGLDLAALHSGRILPVDSFAGQVASPSAETRLTDLAKALCASFDETWPERFTYAQTRKAVVNRLSSFLASGLPFKQVVFSAPLSSGDSSFTVRAHALDTGTKMVFVIQDGRIADIKIHN